MIWRSFRDYNGGYRYKNIYIRNSPDYNIFFVKEIWFTKVKVVKFADLQQLLLVFFILLFSMSSVDVAKFKEAMESIQVGLEDTGTSFLDGGEEAVKEDGLAQKKEEVKQDKPQTITEKKEEQLNKEFKEVKKYLEDNKVKGENLDKYITAIKTNEGIVLRINDVLLFDSGSADIKSNSIEILLKVSDLIKNKNGDVRVEGHTDNVPINSARFSSNWELSTTRATKVISFLLEHNVISPNKLSASGYGEFRPIAPNDTAQNKAKNRRVDIVLLSDFTEIEKSDSK